MNSHHPGIVFKETKSAQGALSLDLAVVVAEGGLLLGYWAPTLRVGGTRVEASQVHIRTADGRSAQAQVLAAQPELYLGLFQAPLDELSPLTFREEAVRIGEPITLLTAVRDKKGTPQIAERSGRVTALYPRGWEGHKAWQIEMSAPLRGGGGPVLDAGGRVVGVAMGDRKPPDKRRGTGLPYRSYAISVGALRPFLENATSAQYPVTGQAL